VTQKEIIRGRLEYARGWLDSVLPRLDEAMLAWAPGEGMRTVSGQLVELIWAESYLVPALKEGKRLSDDEVAAIVGDENSLAGLKKALTEVRTQTLAYLETLSEDELAEPVTLPQWYGAFWANPMPRGEHFRNVAEHEFYHAGQLISYLWARGDDPYKW
jgi:uncharacterized damage-inducible protein DinB